MNVRTAFQEEVNAMAFRPHDVTRIQLQCKVDNQNILTYRGAQQQLQSS